MGFFTWRDPSDGQGARSRAQQIVLQGSAEVDLVIRDMAQSADMAIREMTADSNASWIRTRRWVMAQREKECSGITKEVNRMRARQGLPPI